MKQRHRHYRYQNKRKSILILFLLLLVWSVSVGWGMEMAMGKDNYPQELKSVDPVPERYQLGEELYLDNCSTCHIPIPPAVFPTETWRRILLEREEHYGQTLKPIIRPTLLLMWDYILFASRPGDEGETVPYRFAQSRYFKALHPKVDLPRSVRYQTCISCHPGVEQFNYRSLTPEWEESL